MDESRFVVMWKYNPTSRYLKIFYQDGTAVLFHPVPEFVYQNLLRTQDKAAFVEKYLVYDLHFSHIAIA
ncbi:KTSC domain-containing protein [Acinetobacter sp.]|uniref:KTSC domain-containing protein n=1 Tax=Acinetobacter sp. TaxID=472 RepID=UPI0031E1967B